MLALLTLVAGFLVHSTPVHTAEKSRNSAINLARICINDQCGYINVQGEWVILPRFDSASDFAANGLAAARENGKSGYINTQGEWVIPPKFYSTQPFADNGLAEVYEEKDGKPRYINAKGKWVTRSEWGWYISGGDVPIPMPIRFSSNGLAAAKGNWGYTIEQAELKSRQQRSGESMKFGYINAKGKWVIPPRFDHASNFAANGLASAGKNGKSGYINAQGKWVIPPKFDTAGHFETNGLAPIFENRKMGFINAKGEWVIPPKFEARFSDFSANGLAEVIENGKIGYINAKGEWVIPPRFARLSGGSRFAANGLAWVSEKMQSGYRSGYINSKGEWVVYEDEVFGLKVLKNGRGEIIWP